MASLCLAATSTKQREVSMGGEKATLAAGQRANPNRCTA